MLFLSVYTNRIWSTMEDYTLGVSGKNNNFYLFSNPDWTQILYIVCGVLHCFLRVASSKNRKREDLRKDLRGFQLSNPNIKHVRILLAGEVGAGKSSFINSINSAFQGRITSDAHFDETSGTTFTKTVSIWNYSTGL